MPGRDEMEAREQFLLEYQAQVLDQLVLPPGLQDQYCPQACLKDGERQVYLVRDQAGWPAVLKFQPAGREDALRQEYDLLRGLHHPQLPRPLAYLEWEGTEYLVREYVEGVSLYEQAEARRFSPAQARGAALSLCRVLRYLHSRNPPIICRDVKPQNVVMDAGGQCHLIDLGAARRYRPEQQGDTVFLGTRVTAPPEQFGYRQTDQRSDVYSLGVLLRFLCSGSFVPLPGGAEGGYLGRVIRRCTAFAPENRYPSVRAVYRALKYPWLRRAAGALAGAVCAVLLVFLLWSPAGEARPQSTLLEEAIRLELGLEEGAEIPAERLGEVEQLLVCRQTLVGTMGEHEELTGSAHDRYVVRTVHGDISDRDMELLAQCENLRVLILDYQQISDQMVTVTVDPASTRNGANDLRSNIYFDNCVFNEGLTIVGDYHAVISLGAGCTFGAGSVVSCREATPGATRDVVLEDNVVKVFLACEGVAVEADSAIGIWSDGPDIVLNGTAYNKEELTPDTDFLGVYGLYENGTMTAIKLGINEDDSVVFLD